MFNAKWIGRMMLVAAVSLTASSRSWADEYVHGYYRGNGTYVQPYFRSDPDGNPYNNYSYPGNLNPHTGEIAPGNPGTYLRNYYERQDGVRGNGSGDDGSDDTSGEE